MLLVARFYALMHVWRCQLLAFPLIVIGMNSIAIYCLSRWIQGFIVNSLKNLFRSGLDEGVR